MKGTTHVGFAGLMYLVLFTTAGVSLSAGNAAALAFASVLPDIDTGGSRIGRICPPLTRFLERRFGHRTLTHSLLLITILSLVLLVPILLGSELAASFLLGYATHPFLDTCTPNGVRLFFPFSRLRCVFPFDSAAPRRFRVESGSRLDTALGGLMWLACIPALYVADLGYERFVRLTQHSVESAVRDYESFCGSAVVRIAMTARDGLSGETLVGRFPVAGALNAHTLIFAGPDGRLHSVGKEFEAEYTADNIVSEKGEPAAVVVRQVDMRYQVLGILAAEEGESYCFGDVVTAVDIPLPSRPRGFTPVHGNGKRIHLNFARKPDIEELGLANVLATSGTVVVRSIIRQGASDSSLHARSLQSGGTILTCTVNPGEVLDLKKAAGQTVRRGDTLAVRVVPAFFQEEASLNDRKLLTLRGRARAARQDLDRAIAGAASAAAADSAEYAGAIELARRGFIAEAALGRAAARWEKSKRALGRLIASRALLRERSALEEEKLRLAGEQIRARALVHELKCGILAPVSGILAGVRRDQSGGKEKVFFVIRSGPP